MVDAHELRHERARVTAETDLRARALLRLVPALVHRLNNALAVVQGVHELGPRALEPERGQVLSELAILKSALARIALLARATAGRPRLVTVEALLDSVTLLLRPLAASCGVVLELRAKGSAELNVEERFEDFLVVLCVALLVGGGPEPRRRMRLCARGARGRARLTLSVSDATFPSAEFAALQAYAREHAWPLTQHVTSRAAGLSLSIPAADSARAVAELHPVRAVRRVLLLHGADLERELVSSLLEEHGYAVSACGAEPGFTSGTFDLALIELRLARQDPGLPARLRERFALERVALLEPRMRPGTLLELLGGRPL